MLQEVPTVLLIGHRNLGQNQRCSHLPLRPSPLQGSQASLRCNASRQGLHLMNRNFRGHQLKEGASRSSAPFELAHRKLHHHHVDATYPSLHRLHERSLHVRDQVEVPSQTSDEEFFDAQALDHHAHQEVRVSKLLSTHTPRMIRTSLMPHRYQRSFPDVRQVLGQYFYLCPSSL